MTQPDEETYDIVVGDVDDQGNTVNTVLVRGASLAEAEADFEEHATKVPAEHRYIQLRHSGEDGAVVRTYPAVG
ncbi:hypothetical protein FHR72_001094 [Mycolicibacterium iranicum]|uniref:Uncharacterized protein n=1 Tax=Mycolicibacterium iranicum TaxID=912594 RepID=A0A839QAP7_MYCIR|nr:hypothetical protein [Mycolicibacterium iranicum]MBB2989631.1 hypothetical protein [Mycolicibacterium iranicum]